MVAREPRRRPARVSDAQFRRLLELRSGLRRFLAWSEAQADSAGLTAAQHQLLLAVKGHTDGRGPTVGDVAHHLLLQHHSAVGLIDRADAAGLVHRVRDADDHRVVRLRLTAEGEHRLERLAAVHLDELSRLAQVMRPLLTGLHEDGG